MRSENETEKIPTGMYVSFGVGYFIEYRSEIRESDPPFHNVDRLFLGDDDIDVLLKGWVLPDQPGFYSPHDRRLGLVEARDILRGVKPNSLNTQ